MRKRMAQNLAAAVGGALLGGLLVFFVLARVGRTPSESLDATPVPVPVGTPQAPKPSPEGPKPTPSPAATAEPGRMSVQEAGVSLVLPAGYRVATELNAYEASLSPAAARFIITRATISQEAEYVRLIKDLRAKQAPTEAPEFAPGKTVSLALAASSEETSAAQLAKERTAVTVGSGLAGTRYGRVEGLFPYDVTFVKLAGGKTLAVSMAYASQEESPFDREAYEAVLESLKPL